MREPALKVSAPVPVSPPARLAIESTAGFNRDGTVEGIRDCYWHHREVPAVLDESAGDARAAAHARRGVDLMVEPAVATNLTFWPEPVLP